MTRLYSAAIGFLERRQQHRGVLRPIGPGRQRHRDLVPLAAVAHEGRAGLGQRRLGLAAPDDRLGLRPHRREAARWRHPGRTRRAAAIASARPRRRSARAETRPPSRPRHGRHQHPVEPELLGHPRGMQRRRPAERDQRAPARVLAALDRVDARRVGHVLVDDLADPERRQLAGPDRAFPPPRAASAASAASRSSAMRPPENPEGSMRPSSRSASVTVGAVPPRP